VRRNVADGIFSMVVSPRSSSRIGTIRHRSPINAGAHC
jgi:hypothetical protein